MTVVIWRPIAPHLDPIEVARFVVKVDISGGLRACWPWRGARMLSGYGRRRSSARNQLAHRFALEIKLGRAIAPGMQALHSCDNPPCVNPGHLFEGTNQDNIDDRVAKGRTRRASFERIPRGEQVSTAKLTAGQVVEIRRRISDGSSKRSLGIEFGVSRTTIQQIFARRSWKHIQ
jgi:hypothetical protein